MAKTYYPLTHDEFIQRSSELKDAELRVYLYLMTLNPFPDSVMEIDTARISEHLELTRRTIQRAIKRLQELQLIEIEITKFKYKKVNKNENFTFLFSKIIQKSHFSRNFSILEI